MAATKTSKKIKYSSLPPPLYDIDDTDWMEHLETEGYVVIKDIVDDATAADVVDTFKREFTTVSPRFDWDDTTTWIPANSPMVWSKSSVVFNGFGQSETMWKIRLNPKVQQPFKMAYDTDKLATAFDGLSLFLCNKQKSAKWLHQDQRSNDDRFSIQGAVNFKPVTERDAGFVVVPKSHKTHVPPPSTTDWLMLDESDPHYSEACKLLIPANCMVLWNSKTIHANTHMTKKGMEMNRLTAYITYVPKIRQTKEIVEARKMGYLKGDTTSHWADRHEVKKIPSRLKHRYLKRGFVDLQPKLVDGEIPPEYHELI